MNIVEPIRSKNDIKKIETILQNNPRDLLIFTLGINCGLRISDILALDVKDVKNKSYLDIIEKKTGKSKKFPINTKLKPMIKNFIQNKEENSPLFLSKFNNRMERSQCYRIISKTCKKAGIEYKVGTHSLRKTFGYHYYKKFKDVVMLQKIFNHSTPQITLRYIGVEQDQIFKSCQDFVL